MNIKTSIQNISAYKKYLQVEKAVHGFLGKQGYLKVDLPVLSPALVPESYLEVFETEFGFLDTKEKLFLTPSPELFLKRLMAHAPGNYYYLGKAFRNSEPHSSLHSFEFTMLEYYKIHASYFDIADELLNLLRAIAQELYKADRISYQGKNVSFAQWEKLSVEEAFIKYAGMEKNTIFNHVDFLEKAEKKGYNTKGFAYEDVFSQIYTQEVEPRLGMNGYPTLLYDYPKEFAALAKLNTDGKTAQRFEFYICGVELGDCYTELTDWKEQEKRFIGENKKRKLSKKTAHPIDKGFIEALQYGLADCAGIAIGFERLAMIFANTASIRELKLITIE